MSFQSGFVAIIGRPNVGKSTLLNALVGQKVAITTPVAQTTRHRIKGVLSNKKGQIVFLDTPGILKAKDDLGKFLVDESMAALSDADCYLFVVDGSVPPGKGDQWLAEKLKETGKDVLVVINKMDMAKKPELKTQNHNAYKALFKGIDHIQTLGVSAKTGRNIKEVAPILIKMLPEGPMYYDADQVTDQRLREMTAEIIREKIMLNTRDEIPHSIAIGIESFDESDPQLTRIKATIYVDQMSQKGMIIGKGGQMLKKVGIQARQDIEEQLGNQVFLNLQVKLKKNWRRDPEFLKSLGLAPPI